MTNDNIKRGSQSVSASTGKMTTSPSVTMHVGRNTVEIDPIALKRLLDTLKARLRS